MSIITLRTSSERRHERRGKRELWRTFFPAGAADAFAGGFGALRCLDEERLPPGATLVGGDADPKGELLTFVCEGALKSRGGVLRAGELQRSPAAHEPAPRAKNASSSEWARVLRLELRGAEGPAAEGGERRLFTAADRRGRLLLMASPEGRDGSLRVARDATLHAALLERGHHVVHELPPGRGAWLHVVAGEISFGGVVLSAGDGAGVTGAPALSVTARQRSSIVLLEVGDPPRLRMPGLSAAALFEKAWNEIAELVGPVAAAAVVRRAQRRALPRAPDLGGLEISRVEGSYRYTLPPSFDAAGPAAIRDLLDELMPLLADLAGEAVVLHLGRVPQLRDWVSVPGRDAGAPAREPFVPTGSRELDAVLGGGLPARSQILVAGEPGTGKTILALQVAFQVARRGGKAIYFTTLAEPALKLLRQAQGLSFFDAEAIGGGVNVVDLETVAQTGDGAEVLAAITGRVEQEEPELVVVDGFKAIRELLVGPAEVRKLAFELAVHAAAWGATLLLVGQYSDEEMATLSEFAVADGVLRLGVRRGDQEVERTLEIRKLRGVACAPGRHRFEIGRDGLRFTPQA